jgi:hypothetical protein
MQSEPETAPETPERKTVRRKRFQRGCVRRVKHGRRWVWIGKYREDGIGRTKVLGHCADLTEGGAWAKLQEQLRPLNDRAGQRQALPTNFRSYVANVYPAEDTIIQENPAGSLVTPKEAKTRTRRIIFLLAVLVGMRPGEILAVRWARVDSEMIEVAQRVYRGLPDDPKTERGKRQAALPPDLACDVAAWREISADTGPDTLMFPSERGTFLSRDNFLRRNIQKKLENIGLGWVNFQVLRRT